jgi:hypothetical protein
MDHYRQLILAAKTEIFLATNYWEDSAASRVVVDALKALSEKCGKEGRKVVVKLMYDRGNPKQVCPTSVTRDHDDERLILTGGSKSRQGFRGRIYSQGGTFAEYKGDSTP